MTKKKTILGAVLLLLIAVIVALYSAGYVSLPSLSNTSNLPNNNAQKPANCGNLSVHVFNVSQADAMLIITPQNKTILIDAGSAMKKDSSSRVLSELSNLGIAKLDYVIATHFHEDHIGGMEQVLALFGAQTVYTNGNCANSTTKTTERFLNFNRTTDFKTVNTDMDFPVDSCFDESKLIVPYDRAQRCFSDENDNSILLRIVYGNTSFLFTGDCEGGCEKELTTQNTKLKTDFLKLGHHGSSTSTSDSFLSAVDPSYAVISVDLNRSVSDNYYHPRKSTMERLYGKDVYRTDINGEITAISDGNLITVFPENQASECEIFAGYASSGASSYEVISELDASCNERVK